MLLTGDADHVGSLLELKIVDVMSILVDGQAKNAVNSYNYASQRARVKKGSMQGDQRKLGCF